MKRVLILDDNPINNKKYIKEVEKKYYTDIVLRMQSAVRLIKQRKYDVIVIDVMMPTQMLHTHNEMTAGFDFYNAHLSNLKLKSKIVFWSRLTDTCFDRNKYSDTSIFSFVHKSESPDHLLTAIDKVL